MHKVRCSILDTLAQCLVLPRLNGFGGTSHHVVRQSCEKAHMCGAGDGPLEGWLLSLLQMRRRLCLAAGLTSIRDLQIVIHPNRFEIPTTQKLCAVINIF